MMEKESGIEFKEKDIKVLDFILNKMSNSAFSFNVSDLQKKYTKLTDKDGYVSITHEFDYTKEFRRLIFIMQSYKVGECTFRDDEEFIKAKPYTKQFIEQGGFKRQYEINTERNKRKKILYNKSLSDAELTNKRLKVFPYVFGIAVISFLLSLYSILADLKEQKQKVLSKQKIEQMQLKLKKVQSDLKMEVEKNIHRDKQISNPQKKIKEKMNPKKRN